MSGRIRTIKPELLEDAVTAGISDIAFRLFIGCVLLADDYGRLRYEPAWLKGQVYWRREVPLEEFHAALAELEPLVMPYEVKGQRYGAIRNWQKHQRVDKPGKPRIPEPPESVEKLSRDIRESPAPDLRSPTHEVDLDPERDHARAQGFADAPPETPPSWRDELPADDPPPLGVPLPPDLREVAAEVIEGSGSCDVDPANAWRKYVAWLNERNVRAPVDDARWIRWVADECSAAIRARGRADRREWTGPPPERGRVVQMPLRDVSAPYHGPAKLAPEPERVVTPEERVAAMRAAGLA